ncbi:putative metal-binding motif-containing protein [Thermodesulfobacteriota bacterium]
MKQRKAIYGVVALAGCLAIWMAFAPVDARAAEWHGSIDGYTNADDVYDWELDWLFGRHIGSNYHSRILCFTECYGGDKIDDFEGNPDTAILSGSEPGHTTKYGGYHRGLARNLEPGSDTDTAHAEAEAVAHSADTPTKSGPNIDIGTGGDEGAIESCHVLVWAGRPNSQDQDDINDIYDNFAGEPNTTVTVLSGDGSGAHVDGAATMENLVSSLADIGDVMDENEQFIFFATDHGDLGYVEPDVYCPAELICEVSMDTSAIWDDLQNDPNNNPYLFIYPEEIYPLPPQAALVWFNDVGPFDVATDFMEIPLDYDNTKAEPDQFKYILYLQEDLILPTQNTVQITSGMGQEVKLLHLGLDTGAISRIPSTCTDQDVDGYGYPGNDDCPFPEEDCDDTNPDVNPGMQGQDCLETPDNIDNDCDGQVDEDKCQGCFIGSVM